MYETLDPWALVLAEKEIIVGVEHVVQTLVSRLWCFGFFCACSELTHTLLSFIKCSFLGRLNLQHCDCLERIYPQKKLEVLWTFLGAVSHNSATLIISCLKMVVRKRDQRLPAFVTFSMCYCTTWKLATLVCRKSVLESSHKLYTKFHLLTCMRIIVNIKREKFQGVVGRV